MCVHIAATYEFIGAQLLYLCPHPHLLSLTIWNAFLSEHYLTWPLFLPYPIDKVID